jgi:hypothetical protein
MSKVLSGQKYVERGGELVPPQPYLANGVDFYGFSMAADRAAMQANVCDRFLNGPLGQENRFVPVSKHVLVVFNRIDSLSSEGHDEFGFSTESEAAIWMLVADTSRVELSWFHPYMLVDSDTALGCGREVYGFPKTIGWMDVPSGGTPPTELVAETMMVINRGERRERHPLITVRRQGPASKGHSPLGGIEELRERIVRDLGLGNERERSSALGGLLLPNLKVPFVFLKQIRDGANGTVAAFQSVQRAKPQASNPSLPHFFHDPYTVDIADALSHPIRSDFGLAGGTIDVGVAFWLKFDFKIGSCEDISEP